MKRWLRLVLQVLSLALFGLILWLGGSTAWQQIAAGAPKHVLAAFLLIGIASMLSAARLQLITCSITGRELTPWRGFYHVNMTARTLGLVIPRSLTTFAGKPVALRALGFPLKRSILSVLLDNLFDLVLLSLIAIPALLFLEGRLSPSESGTLVVGLILALTGGLWWATSKRRSIIFPAWIRRIPHLASIELENDILLPSRSIVMQVLGLTILLNFALTICYYHISRAIELTYPWSIFAAGFPAVQLSLVLAVTPGGLGVFDASWYGVLLLGGVSHQDALTFVIAQRAYIFVFVLIWAGFSTLLSLTLEGEKGN
jgi:uncharacterized membrane protein YbhN (UPF0104 family)